MFEHDVGLAAQLVDIHRCVRDHAMEMPIISGSASEIVDRRRPSHWRIQEQRRKFSSLLICPPGDEWLQFLRAPEHAQCKAWLLPTHQNIAKLRIGIGVI